jgi:hypothetical protein
MGPCPRCRIIAVLNLRTCFACLPMPAPACSCTLQICFVGDEQFRQLSKVDDDAPQLLAQAISKDHSREWQGNKARKQEEAAAGAAKAAAPAAAPTQTPPAAAAAAPPAAAAALAASPEAGKK